LEAIVEASSAGIWSKERAVVDMDQSLPERSRALKDPWARSFSDRNRLFYLRAMLLHVPLHPAHMVLQLPARVLEDIIE
jgi:hypothetical protein